MSVRFIISYTVLLLLFFHEKVFGKLSHPDVSLSFFGQPRGIGFSWEITCGLGALISLTRALWVIVVDHLLLYCGKIYRLWSFVYSTFGISWVPSRLVTDFLFGWWNGWGSIHLTFGI